MDNENSVLQTWAKKYLHPSSPISPKSVSSRKSSSISIPQQEEKDDGNEEIMAASCSERNLTGSFLLQVYGETKDVPKTADTSKENETVKDNHDNDKNESIPGTPRSSYDSTNNDKKEENIFDMDDFTTDDETQGSCYRK